MERILRHFDSGLYWLVVVLTAVLATIFLESGLSGKTRGALRFLVLMTLALPAFMIASWLLDLHTLNPTDVGLARSLPARVVLVPQDTRRGLTADRPYYDDYQTRCERRIPLVRLVKQRLLKAS